MKIHELIEKSRSYRRFDESVVIERQTLVELVDLARLSPTAANRQSLRFILSCDPETNNRVFQTLKWAAYLKGWTGPKAGEKPTAYIIILNDSDINKAVGCDHGIAAQSILLGAVERGFGGCILGAVEREELSVALDIDMRFEIMLVLAIGKPVEKVQIEPVGPDGDIHYWRDEAGIHHVPKRSLDDLIL